MFSYNALYTEYTGTEFCRPMSTVHACTILLLFITPLLPSMGAMYCDQRVCMSVCLSVYVRSHISKTTRLNFTKFYLHVTYGGGSVILCRQCNTLCTSGVVDDVMLSKIIARMVYVSLSSPGGGTGGKSAVSDCILPYHC